MSISRRCVTPLVLSLALFASACGGGVQLESADHVGGEEANQAEIDAALAELAESDIGIQDPGADDVDGAVSDPGEHSLLVGFHSDGLPIYGPLDVNGQPPTDLDECSGHVGPTPDANRDTYHYHIADGDDPASIETEGCGQ